MTNPSCRIPLIWIAELAFIALLGLSVPACAVSKKYDGEVSVVLVDGKPCFYAAQKMLSTRDAPEWWDVSVGVSQREANFNAVWVAGIKLPPPASVQRCVVYGFEASTVKLRVPAAPLSKDITAYEVFLGIGSSGLGYGGNYGLRFCYGLDAGGTPVLRRWDAERLKCAAAGLPSQPEADSK